MLNWQEYIAGTDPRDPQSVLRLTAVPHEAGGANMTVMFAATTNRTYSVLWKESVDAGKWSKLADVTAQPLERVEIIADPLPPAFGRIYRVVTPQQPGPVLPMPAILSSPRSVVTDVGGNAAFNVVAVGNGPLNHHWMFNSNLVPTIAGPSLPITSAQFSDIGIYSVSVQDMNNTEADGQFYLAVRPRILIQPQSQSASPGEAVTFSVMAEGVGPLSYRWWRSRRPITGQTNSTLVLTNVQSTDATNYAVTVMHELPWGRLGIGSSNAVLTLIEAR
jgi:hypothetical protein